MKLVLLYISVITNIYIIYITNPIKQPYHQTNGLISDVYTKPRITGHQLSTFVLFFLSTTSAQGSYGMVNGKLVSKI